MLDHNRKLEEGQRQYRVISNQGSSTISSPNFVLKHTKQPMFNHTNSPIKYLFIQFNDNYYLYSCVNDDNVVDYIQENYLVKLDVMFDADEGDKIILVGCSNGLVCLAEQYGKYFFLYNPATNESYKYYSEEFGLNSDGRRPWVSWGFGHVSSVNDHKVVRIMMNWGHVVFSIIHVFSLNCNCWRKIEFDIGKGLLYGGAKLVDETLYWVKVSNDMMKEKTLAAFDLESETFQWFPHLISKTRAQDVLCVMGGCLSVCGSNNSDNEVVFDIMMRGSGRMIRLCYGCDVRVESADEVIGFTKTGKVFVAHVKHAMISMFDQTSKQTLVAFEVEDGEESETHIQSYVPSETSPLPLTEMPTSSSQETRETSYEDDLVEEVDIDDSMGEVDIALIDYKKKSSLHY